MSAELAATGRGLSRARSRLRALPGLPTRMSNLAFTVAVSLVLAFGLVAALVLNTTLQSQSAELATRKAAVESLSHKEAALSSSVDTRRSATQLQASARKLGMVPDSRPAFIDLRTGKVIGTPHKVTGKELPGLAGNAPVSAGDR